MGIVAAQAAGEQLNLLYRNKENNKPNPNQNNEEIISKLKAQLESEKNIEKNLQALRNPSWSSFFWAESKKETREKITKAEGEQAEISENIYELLQALGTNLPAEVIKEYPNLKKDYGKKDTVTEVNKTLEKINNILKGIQSVLPETKNSHKKN